MQGRTCNQLYYFISSFFLFGNTMNDLTTSISSFKKNIWNI